MGLVDPTPFGLHRTQSGSSVPFSESNHDITTMLNENIGVIKHLNIDESLTLDLALHFPKRFQETNSITDLNGAIRSMEKTLDAIPQGDPRRSVSASLLGSYYGTRFERTNSLPDLDCAMEITREAIDVTEDLMSLGIAFAGLETWLSRRYDRLVSEDDLEEAIEAAEMAVNLTPQEYSEQLGRINDIGLRLSQCSERFGSREDLDKAIEYIKMGVASTLAREPLQRVNSLVNLGVTLHSRFKENGMAQDLVDSIQALEEAVDIVPPQHPMRATCWNSLGILLTERFDELIKEIQSQPGFFDFFRPPSKEALKSAASEGPWEGSIEYK